MTWHTFGRSALFAAVAASAWLPWVVVTGPMLGVWGARAVYLSGVTALYVLGLGARGWRLLPALVAGVAGIAIAILARSTTELALGLAALLGLARSAFLYRAAPARAVTTEVLLLGGGLLFARFLAAAAPFSTALALWGFLLVQSAFFLIGGVQPRHDPGARRDPFDEARARALALLDGLGT